jgi:antitoxin HicB
MTADELLRRLRRRRDIRIVPSRGKGGHVRVERDDRVPDWQRRPEDGPFTRDSEATRLDDPRPVIGGRVKRISDRAAWPVDLIPAEEGGLIVNFPDLPNGWSQGETRDEALEQAEDLLDEMILGRMAHNEDVPRPSPPKGRPVVAPPALTAAKFEAYRAMRAAGLNKSQLAERLGWQPSQVTRLFDGRHASRLDQIDAALHALGRRLVVTSTAG